MRPPLRCIWCKQQFPRKHGQGLFCSLEHAELHRKEQTMNAAILTSHGYEADGNKFTLNGVSTTLEEVRHLGIEAVHARISQQAFSATAK